MLEVPTPNRLLMALKARRTGADSETAAFSTELFSIPTKYVSAMLYKTMTRELKTMGMDSFATAAGIGVFSNNIVF